MGKMFAPTFFALVFIALIAVYIRFVLMLPIPGFYKVLGALVLASLIVAMGYQLIKRHKEIQEEDSDDLSKY
jgi:membrane protein implicated in regulation of membrane protease activity